MSFLQGEKSKCQGIKQNHPLTSVVPASRSTGKGSPGASELLHSGAIYLLRALSYWKTHKGIDLGDATAS